MGLHSAVISTRLQHCCAYPQCTKYPKLRSGCQLRHDWMNFEDDQMRSGHAHQPFSVLCHGLSSLSTSVRPFNGNQCNPWCVHELHDRLEASRTCVAPPRELFSMNTFGSGGPLPSLDSVTAFASFIQCNLFHGVVPNATHFEHSKRASNDSRAQLEARLSPLCF